MKPVAARNGAHRMQRLVFRDLLGAPPAPRTLVPTDPAAGCLRETTCNICQTILQLALDWPASA